MTAHRIIGRVGKLDDEGTGAKMTVHLIVYSDYL